MNLLTLLRTNLYTQKQMGFILGMKPHNVSRLVCDLERRGYIGVEPMEILGVMENYTRLRNQSIRGEHDVS